MILLVGALLLFRSVVGLQSVDPGLDARNVLTFRVSIPGGALSGTAPADAVFCARGRSRSSNSRESGLPAR